MGYLDLDNIDDTRITLKMVDGGDAKRVRQQRTWRLYLIKGGSKKWVRKNRPDLTKKKTDSSITT